MRVALSALALSLVLSSVARANDNSSDIAKLFSEIDLSSFASSLGPKHLPSGTTLKDLGWSIQDSSKQSATYVAADGGWSYAIRLIQKDNNKIVVCFIDKGLKDTHYLSSRLERLHAVTDSKGQRRYVADAFRSRELCPGPGR
ncbi:hypothetical protein J2D73_10710 [Acetobacter sacchari]|uniref:Uncharacterized protein n=1 Tax=Acetobacter sacchari TaxID=2661687 RepID=A0ABS3LWG1_9PROT|nr:hypothetical protein [Acetobacter sacchari]MBO1360257.1 hypothetical protein [Acetobacter sacchari]